MNKFKQIVLIFSVVFLFQNCKTTSEYLSNLSYLYNVN